MVTSKPKSERYGSTLRVTFSDKTGVVVNWPPKDLNGRTLAEYMEAMGEAIQRKGVDVQPVMARVIRFDELFLEGWKPNHGAAKPKPVEPDRDMMSRLAHEEADTAKRIREATHRLWQKQVARRLGT